MFKKSNSDFISNIFCTQQEQSLCWWRWKLFSYSFTHTNTHTLYLSPKFLKSWHKKNWIAQLHLVKEEGFWIKEEDLSKEDVGKIKSKGNLPWEGGLFASIFRIDAVLSRLAIIFHFILNYFACSKNDLNHCWCPFYQSFIHKLSLFCCFCNRSSRLFYSHCKLSFLFWSSWASSTPPLPIAVPSSLFHQQFSLLDFIDID